MAEILIWVVTAPAVAVYLWAIIGWKRQQMRIAATALFLTFWLAVPQFVTMDLVWRILMPSVVVLAMASILLQSRRPHPAGTSR